jgi:hypothetical protein
MTTCPTCKYYRFADQAYCDWEPIGPYPLWCEAVEMPLSAADIAEAEDACPAWQPRPAESAA